MYRTNVYGESILTRMGHREALIEGARQCLTEKGFGRTTARDLVEASGTNLGSIGYHFGSKDAVLYAAISETCEEWTAQLKDVLFQAESESPLEHMARAWTALTSQFQEHRPLLIAYLEAVAHAQHSEQWREEMADHYQRLRAQVGQLARQSFQQHGQADTADNAAVASFLIAVIDGLMIQWLLDPDNTPVGTPLMEALGAALTQSIQPLATSKSDD
jgi:AcrR family transcriptional regulator